MNVRILSGLDVKGPKFVKGIQLEGLIVQRKPRVFARFYFENGADKLLFIDFITSLYERNNLFEIIAETGNNVFIPLTFGVGKLKMNDIRNLLRADDKVLINTAAIRNPDFI